MAKLTDSAIPSLIRLERTSDPVFSQRLKDAATADISVGGPHLAAEAIRAGLVDEAGLVDQSWMLVCPIIGGGGTPFLPDGVRVPLELLAKREFGGGVLSLRYAAILDSQCIRMILFTES